MKYNVTFKTNTSHGNSTHTVEVEAEDRSQAILLVKANLYRDAYARGYTSSTEDKFGICMYGKADDAFISAHSFKACGAFPAEETVELKSVNCYGPIVDTLREMSKEDKDTIERCILGHEPFFIDWFRGCDYDTAGTDFSIRGNGDGIIELTASHWFGDVGGYVDAYFEGGDMKIREAIKDFFYGIYDESFEKSEIVEITGAENADYIIDWCEEARKELQRKDDYRYKFIAERTRYYCKYPGEIPTVKR